MGFVAFSWSQSRHLSRPFVNTFIRSHKESTYPFTSYLFIEFVEHHHQSALAASLATLGELPLYRLQVLAFRS